MEKHKFKILMVHNYYQIPGGEDTVVANEKKMLEDCGHEVILYSRHNIELERFSVFQKLLLPFITIFNVRTYHEIRNIIKEKKIDIVHVHNTLLLISPSVFYASIVSKVPVVQTIHNFRMLCPGATFYRDGHICEDCVKEGLKCAIQHKCYRGSRLQSLLCVVNTKIHRMTGIYRKINYICLTEFNKNKLLQLKQIREEQIFIKPNFTFDVSIQKKLSDFYLYIGRIEEIKGISIIIDAFSRMPDKKIIIAGTGVSLEKYKRIIVEKKLSNIEFRGFVEKPELLLLLQKARAVLVASQWYETFGMVVVEAFASRTPVIAGDIGNIGNFIDDHIDGIKFKYESSDSLIEAINRFEKSDIKVMSKNAYEKYSNKYTKESNYKIIKDAYTKISRGGVWK